MIRSLINLLKPKKSVESRSANRPSVIMFTMVYNHGPFVQRWVNHHHRQLGRECLLVVDHGSTDGSTNDLKGINRLNIPRSDLDEGQRADFINDLQKTLLHYHDVVIYSDCDEFLIPDPRKYRDLHEFLAAHSQDVIRPIGIQMSHLRDRESSTLLATKPILGQRKFGFMMKAFSKPLVTRVPVTWYPGCHDCSVASAVTDDLLLIHANYADYALIIKRQAMMREIAYSERHLAHWSHHQRASDAEIDGLFQSFINGANLDAPRPLNPSEFVGIVSEDLQSHDLSENNRDIRSPIGTIPDWLIGAV